MKRLFPFFISLIALCLFLSSTAFAEVQVRVRIIEASHAGTGVDPVLEDVHGELGSLFNFNSYRLLKEVRVDLVGNRTVDVTLHPGRSMEVTLVGEYKRLIELRIKMIREGVAVLNTNVRLAPGRTILIGGPRHGGATPGTLIFAVSARF